MTSKRQVTIPKAIADRYGIAAGDEIEFVAAGDAISVRPATPSFRIDPRARLRRFDQATQRQEIRQRERRVEPEAGGSGWRRQDLYERGSAR